MDEYTLLDGDKMASVRPMYGVKQGCPLSPLLFAIYLNDLGSVTDNIQGALTAIPNFTVNHLLFADDLVFVANRQSNLQAFLNNLKEYASKKSLVVNTQKSVVLCFNSRSTNLPSFFYDGSPLPYTDHFRYLGMIFDKNLNLSSAADAALQLFMNGTFKIQRFAHENQLTNRLHASSGSLKPTLFLLVCMQARFGRLLSSSKAKKWTTPYRNGFLQHSKDGWVYGTQLLLGLY
jgi:hypothetical protein